MNVPRHLRPAPTNGRRAVPARSGSATEQGDSFVEARLDRNSSRTPAPAWRPWTHASRGSQGAVLLEVVLALVLFVAAAAVIAGAVNASLEGVQRQRLNTHAVNLAVSVLSELQIGLRSTEAGGPEPFAVPFEQWTWELALSGREEQGTEPSGLTLVEVIVRHDDPPVVYRLAQVLKLEKTPGPVASAGGNF